MSATDSDREALARLIYEDCPADDGGEYIDGFRVAPGGPISWERACRADAEFRGQAEHSDLTASSYALADAILAAGFRRAEWRPIEGEYTPPEMTSESFGLHRRTALGDGLPDSLLTELAAIIWRASGEIEHAELDGYDPETIAETAVSIILFDIGQYLNLQPLPPPPTAPDGEGAA